MARTPTFVNQDKLKEILSSLPEGTPKGMVYFKVADLYNQKLGKNEVPISANIAKSRLHGNSSPKSRSNETGINVIRIPNENFTYLPLTDFSHEGILGWVDRQREVSRRNNEYMSRDALMYLVRKRILSDNPDKSRAVCQILRDHVQDEY